MLSRNVDVSTPSSSPVRSLSESGSNSITAAWYARTAGPVARWHQRSSNKDRSFENGNKKVVLKRRIPRLGRRGTLYPLREQERSDEEDYLVLKENIIKRAFQNFY